MMGWNGLLKNIEYGNDSSPRSKENGGNMTKKIEDFYRTYTVTDANGNQIPLEKVNMWSEAYHLWGDGPRTITAHDYIMGEKTRSTDEMAYAIENRSNDYFTVLKNDEIVICKLSDKDKRFHYCYEIKLGGKSVHSSLIPGLRERIEGRETFELIAWHFDQTWVGDQPVHIQKRTQVPQGVPGYGPLLDYEKKTGLQAS